MKTKIAVELVMSGYRRNEGNNGAQIRSAPRKMKARQRLNCLDQFPQSGAASFVIVQVALPPHASM